MRTVTVTEKYRAVQEGKMAKSVFLQQMKRQYPFFISQFDSFDSSVAILKNKGMLFEAKEEVYDKDYYKFSDEGVRRGTDAELEKMGIDSTRPGNISKEDLEKAKETALKNLRKDPLYYLNLISGDSLHVDKHDKPVEYKKGNEKDVFNGMKKAELKEEVSEADAIPTEPGIPGERASNHNRKMALRKIIDVLTKDGHPEKGYKVSNDEALSFIKTYRDEIFDGTIDYNSPEAIWDEYEEGESVDRDDVGEGGNIEHNCANHVMHEKYGHGICLEGKHTLLEDGTVTHYDVFFKEGSKTVENIPVNELNILTSSHHGHKRNKKKNEEVEEQMTDQQMKDIQNYGKADKIVKPFKPGDMWSDDFDYEGMLEAALKIRLNTPLETMEALYSSFEDVNYHSENQHLGRAIDAKKEGDKSDALDNLRNFRKAVKETLVSINEGGDPLRDVEEVMGYNRRGEKEEEPRPSNYTKVSEKKGKDHDKDGDIDSDDYMAAKDKAIKKAMGKEVSEADRDEESMVHELIGDLFAPGNARSHLDFSVKEIARNLKRYGDHLTRQGVKDAMDLYDKLAADGTLDKEVEDGDGFVSSYHVPKLKKAFELIGLYGKDMNESVVRKNLKSIITKVLEEEVINEAATNDLAKIADEYEDFGGLKPAVISLQNIVTEIESFYDKTREKIQKVYDALGNVTNDEGLKVGAFITPSIENAFKRDLKHIIKNQFTGGLNMPQVRRISQDDINRGTVQQEAPKDTVFSPVNEKTNKNEK